MNNIQYNSDFAYLILGFTKEQIEFLTPDNNGTLNPGDYVGNNAYLLYNNNHCVMATRDKFDEYSDLLSVDQFVRKHSSLFKPGKRCWAYKLK